MPVANINGISLDYETWGNPAHPAALLISGLGMQRVAWPSPFVEALVSSGLHVVTFDNRDVGRSSIMRDIAPSRARIVDASGHKAVPYTLSDMARDALGLLDLLEIPRAHAIGVSMGGMIAQHLAFDHPRRVLSLTSIMSTTGNRAVGQPTPIGADLLRMTMPTDHDAFIPAFVERQRRLSGPLMFDAALARDLAERVFARGVHPPGVARQLKAVLADGDRTARLKQVAAPTLVIHGVADPLIDVSGGRATAAAIPGAALDVIEGMGHGLDRPVLPRITGEICEHIAAAMPMHSEVRQGGVL